MILLIEILCITLMLIIEYYKIVIIQFVEDEQREYKETLKKLIETNLNNNKK